MYYRRLFRFRPPLGAKSHDSNEEIAEAAKTAIADKGKAVPRKIRVSGGVIQSSAVKRVQLEYPLEAKAAGVSGEVKIRVLISEEGNVMEAEAVEGPEPLREPAPAAARLWVSGPTELSGEPVKVEGALTFRFTLR